MPFPLPCSCVLLHALILNTETSIPGRSNIWKMYYLSSNYSLFYYLLFCIELVHQWTQWTLLTAALSDDDYYFSVPDGT